MPIENYGLEGALGLPDVSSIKKRVRRSSRPFLLGLVVNDFIVSCCVFLIFESQVELFPATEWWRSLLAVMAFALMPTSFLLVHKLYNCHSIFSNKKHAVELTRAIGWGLVAICIAVGQYMILWSRAEFSWLAAAVSGACILSPMGVVMLFRRRSFYNVISATGISLIIVAFTEIILKGRPYALAANAWILVFAFLAAGILISGMRMFIVANVYKKWFKMHFRTQVGIIGVNEEARAVASHIIAHNAPFWIAGTIGSRIHLNIGLKKAHLGDLDELEAVTVKNRLSEIIVTDEQITKPTLVELLEFVSSNGLTIWLTPRLLPIIERKLRIDSFCGIPMIRMCAQRRFRYSEFLKHAIDALLSLPLLIILSPVLGFIAAAIKLDSRGPVFYKARAIGKNGREFKMLKFRSMCTNNDCAAHKIFVTKLIKGEIGGECCQEPLKITNDPRITRVGRFLRKYSLDELPQLINVIQGEMSLIGPRPCLPYEYQIYKDWYRKRTDIRPGITGLWQVVGRSEVQFEEMIVLDLYYLYNHSFWMDLMLLIETVFVVLKKKGAY